MKKSPSSTPRRHPRVNSSARINEIVEHIEIGVLFGEYRPREHLVQDQLAKKYGVERNLIRAVLRSLEERSIIEHFPNRGSMVKEFTAKNAKDLYRLRFLVEGAAAEMAVKKMTPEILRQLECLRKDMERKLKAGELRGFTLDHEKFHQLIFEASDNFYLLKAIKELRGASSSIRNFSYSRYSLPERRNHLFKEHKQMVALLKKGDVSQVGQLARSHIKAGISHYLRHFFPTENPIE